MIHGLSADNLSSLFYTLAPPVAPDAHVVLYDLRGHGRSARPATGYGLDDSVTDLAALLDTIDATEPVHLVGHSYGGAVALSFAVTHPERVASIALVEGHAALDGWAAYQAASIAFLAFGLEKPEVVRWMDEEAGRKARRSYLDVKALIHETSLVEDIEHRTTTSPGPKRPDDTAPVLRDLRRAHRHRPAAAALTEWLPDVERHQLDGQDTPCSCRVRTSSPRRPWLRHQAERVLATPPGLVTPAASCSSCRRSRPISPTLAVRCGVDQTGSRRGLDSATCQVLTDLLDGWTWIGVGQPASLVSPSSSGLRAF